MINGRLADEILDKLLHHQIPAVEQPPSQRSSARFNGQATNGDVSMLSNIPYCDNNEALHLSVTADLNGKVNDTSQPLASSAREDAAGRAVEVYPMQQPKQDFDERIESPASPDSRLRIRKEGASSLSVESHTPSTRLWSS